MRVRDAHAHGDGRALDVAFVERMLFEAFFWRPDAERPSLDAFRDREPEHRKLLRDLGARAGDCIAVAEGDAGERLGAAWYRFWTAAEHSYGWVAADVPELAIAVEAAARGRGVGRALMEALVARARERGVRALSLSVDPENRAIALYRSLGFREVGCVGTSLTLVLEIGRGPYAARG